MEKELIMPLSVSGRKGFALVELMISMLIFGIIVAAVFFLFSISSRYSERVNARLELQQGLLSASSIMSDDLMQTGPSVLFRMPQNVNMPADGNFYTSIKFKKAAAPDSGSKAWSTGDIVYSLGGVNNALIRTEGSLKTVICENMTKLTFKRTSAEPDVIEVEMQAQVNASKDIIVEDKQFRVRMRN